MIRRLLERVTPSGRRERRELRDRVTTLLAGVEKAERRRRARHIFETYISP